ncbi:hypothetical protein [Thiorhodococcus minor]|uniref:Uncharacterized protein n=1 Tax=Thiorhodococcus minor TaxID=57489 RepID=A0A6M0K4D4_9GAMM|nr:hypothetical protein [Thiorhodococcus minor]NEV64144.1 hypothetical protein [Thiorhodococcus minor]
MNEDHPEHLWQQMLGPKRRLPTIAEIEALRIQFADLGLDKAPLYDVREAVVIASLMYHELVQPAPNKALEHLRQAKKNASALLATLYPNDSVMRAVTSPIEPYMMREKLEQLIGNVEREIGRVSPLAAPGQRRRPGYGLRRMIEHLSSNVILWTGGDSHPTYTQNNTAVDREFTGIFVELTEAVCRLSGIHAANSTVGGAIKELDLDGRIPYRPERDAIPTLWP